MQRHRHWRRGSAWLPRNGVCNYLWHAQRQRHLQQKRHALRHADVLALPLCQQLLLFLRQFHVLRLAIYLPHPLWILQWVWHFQC